MRPDLKWIIISFLTFLVVYGLTAIVCSAPYVVLIGLTGWATAVLAAMVAWVFDMIKELKA